MEKLFTDFWFKLENFYQNFAGRIVNKNDKIFFKIEKISNESFPLIGCLSFWKNIDEETLVLSVDIFALDDGYRVTADVIVDGDNHRVIAVGPEATFETNMSKDEYQLFFDSWFENLELFYIFK